MAEEMTLEAAAEAMRERCAKHVESLLEYGERDWDAPQLAREIRALPLEEA